MAGQASIKFYLFEGSKKEGVFPIYMRITYARKKAELHTGFTCTKKEWNAADQNTRTSTTVKVKDIFVFSCYTGLRFQDAQNLKTDNLTSYNKKAFLRFAQEKTGRAIDIPLLPVAKRILDKYKDEPERKILHKLLPKISNQKVNAYLKTISDLADLKKTLTHHMARHTFATTICLNNGMPMEDVSKLLGHSSLKTTAIYGRITQDRLQKSMERVNKKM